MGSLTRMTTEEQVSAVLEAAERDPNNFAALLKAKGITSEQAIAILETASRKLDDDRESLEATRRKLHGIMALLQAAGVETLGDTVAAAATKSQYPLVIGQPVTHPGRYFSELIAYSEGSPVRARCISLRLIPDFLRDASGEIVTLNGNQAIDAITAFNGGLKYGAGYEKANESAVGEGEFRDGTLILAPRSVLIEIAREHRSRDFPQPMKGIIASSLYDDNWCVTSPEDSGYSASVCLINLSNGVVGWGREHKTRSRVVALRGYNIG
jgi:hypothetical protein